MKIALIGYGKMGKAVEEAALKRGHEIVSIIDVGHHDAFRSEAFRSADVAIEFTRPDTAFDNYMQCFAAGVPVVSGTTGWLDRLDEVKAICRNEGRTFFYASNFSIGMNLFFAVNAYLAKLMNRFTDYDVQITETHHIHKLDAPSGTAITLADDILKAIDRKTHRVSGKAEHPKSWRCCPSAKEKCRVSTRWSTIRRRTSSVSATVRKVVPVWHWAPCLRQSSPWEKQASSE